MNRVLLRTIVGITVAVAFGCHHHADSMELQLLWMPTDNPHDMPPAALEAFNGQTVAIAVTDTRVNSGPKIGENHEDSTPRPVTTTDDLRAFVGKNIAAVLQSNGVKIVPSGASRLLTFELAEFFVTENNFYQGNVTFQVTLHNGAGQVLWTGSARGSSHRFGRSFSEENYDNTFSDATLDALRALLGDVSFQTALRTNP